MSRECNLDLRFPISESETELAEQLAGLLKEWHGFDDISADKDGIYINEWNSEHYRLADSMPFYLRIVASVFPNKEIQAEGRGKYSVVDDIYEYLAGYNPKYKEIFGSKDHFCPGTGEEYDTLFYDCHAGLTEEELGKMIPIAERLGYTQLLEHLKAMQSIPERTADGSGWVANFRDCKELADEKGFVVINGLLYDCPGAETDLILPEGLTEISDHAFDGWDHLSSVTIPDSVTSIGWAAFYGCSGLTDITIPDSVMSIGDYAFYDCENLTRVTVPETVSIGFQAFAGTPFEKALYDDPANWEDGMLYMGNILIKADESLSGEYTVKDGVKGLAGGAFMNCSDLTDIIIPDSVLWIGSRQLDSYEKNRKSVTILGAARIEEWAFYGCKNLTIRAPAGSEAERFAKEDGIPFEAV